MRENVQIWSKKWFHETDDVHTKTQQKSKIGQNSVQKKHAFPFFKLTD